MSTEDGYAYVPGPLGADGLPDGPGVYVVDPEWLVEVCTRNARLLREDTARAAAQSTQDGKSA